MSEITLEAITYDGKSFAHDDDGNATTAQGKRLEQIGFSQREVAHPRYDAVLVLDHSGASGRVSSGQVVVVHNDSVLGVIDAAPIKPAKKAVAKKAAKKK